MTLKSTTALNNLQLSVGEFSLREISNRAKTTLSFSNENRDTVNQRCLSELGASLPGTGGVSHGQDGLTLLGLQSNQVWCLQHQDEQPIINTLSARLDSPDIVYLTDQSDAWADVALSGANVIKVLERLCILDLDTKYFPVNTVARSLIDHMGTVLVRTGVNTFEMMVPRSFASSMLHAVENVALHIENENFLQLFDATP